MKLDRLLAITMTLMNKRRIQAKELADLFDVSVRTIYRDIESLNMAGIPVITYQGINGGIGIVDGYKLDKTLLTNDELASIVSALKSVASYSDTRSDRLLDKLQGVVQDKEAEAFRAKTEQIFVDFSSWGNEAFLKEKIDIIKEAIQSFRVISFVYRGSNGESSAREVDPYTIVLKSQKWYLYGYCKLRKEFRIFRLSRMKDIKITDSSYQRQPIDLEQIPWMKGWHQPSNTVQLVLKFAADMKTMIEEWFGSENILVEEADYSIVQITLPEENWVYGFILGFGDRVEVLEPEDIRRKVKEIAKKIYRLYNK